MIAAGALWRPSPNVRPRVSSSGEAMPRVDMIVLHYTGMASANAAVDWLTSPSSKLSAHYLIASDGSLIAMVDERQEAWHAGRSSWYGERANNARSIGIELDSQGHTPFAPVFPMVQIRTLLRLLDELRVRWPCPLANVVAHSDIAPHRKADPGERFPWACLAAAGHALAVDPVEMSREESTLPVLDDESEARAGVEAQRQTVGAGAASGETRPIETLHQSPQSAGARAPPLCRQTSLLTGASAHALRGLGYGLDDAFCDALVIRAFHRRHRPSHLMRPFDAGSMAIARALRAAIADSRG